LGREEREREKERKRTWLMKIHFFVCPIIFLKKGKPSVVVHSSNPSTQVAEKGGLWIPGQLELHRETCLKEVFKVRL
jgi:hypothetical protein